MHPWGLSGPQFLWLYAAGLLAGLVVVVVSRTAVRRPSAGPAARPSAEELGFLAGGPVHAVVVAVARLYEAGLLRVNRDGAVSAVPGTRTAEPFGNAVLSQLAKPRTVAAVARKDRVRRALDEMGGALVRRGLLVAPAKAAGARRTGLAVVYVVFAAGIVRWVNGLANDLPVGYLTALLAATLVLLVLLHARAIAGPRARTVHGDRVVAEVRALGRAADPFERLAVSGPGEHADEDLSRALSLAVPAVLVPAAWSYASAGSFHSTTAASGSGSGTSGAGYSCSSGGGFSCGGSSGGGSSCGGGGGGCGGGSS